MSIIIICVDYFLFYCYYYYYYKNNNNMDILLHVLFVPCRPLYFLEEIHQC